MHLCIYMQGQATPAPTGSIAMFITGGQITHMLVPAQTADGSTGYQIFASVGVGSAEKVQAAMTAMALSPGASGSNIGQQVSQAQDGAVPAILHGCNQLPIGLTTRSILENLGGKELMSL